MWAEAKKAFRTLKLFSWAVESWSVLLKLPEISTAEAETLEF